MPAMTLQACKPWSVAHEEDRRFRWILTQTLAVSLVVGAITPYIRLPQPDAGIDSELPPRRVRLLTEQPKPAGRPAPAPTTPLVNALPAAPVVTAPPPPKPQTVPEKPPVTPVVTPRQKAARSGVLAMGAALTELRINAPQTGARPGREYTGMEIVEDSSRPSALTENVTRGSGGIAGGVAHQSVLGTDGLPDREESRQGGNPGSSLEGSEAARGQTSSGPPGVVRSQEEIQELLDRNKGAMYTLYNRELRENASLQGKLVMSITIAPAGNVTRCIILSSELGSVSLEQQLVALIKRIDFGNRPGVAEVTTKIPIEFFPR
jgi:protein TonB